MTANSANAADTVSAAGTATELPNGAPRTIRRPPNPRSAACSALLAAAAACAAAGTDPTTSRPEAGTPPSTPSNVETARATEAHDAAAGLVQAEPGRWHVAMRRVLDLGPAAAPALADALRENPTAPGAQAAIATLGALGDPQTAEPLLRSILRERAPHAAEAALALGRLRAPESRDALAAAVRDRTADVLTRTAAASALLDCEQLEPAATFLHAILVAGSPAGVAPSEAFGLPDKTRWAHERLIAIEAVRRYAEGESFGLHPDAPWPELARGAEAFLQHVRARRQR